MVDPLKARAVQAFSSPAAKSLGPPSLLSSLASGLGPPPFSQAASQGVCHTYSGMLPQPLMTSEREVGKPRLGARMPSGWQGVCPRRYLLPWEQSRLPASRSAHGLLLERTPRGSRRSGRSPAELLSHGQGDARPLWRTQVSTKQDLTDHCQQ